MDQTEIGKFIATCRKEAGLTQAKLAEKLGITDRAVSKWENGKSLPDSSIMLELCAILGITVNELLSGEKVGSEDYGKKVDENLIALKRKDEGSRAKNVAISILFSVALLIGIMVCLICDLAISKRLTWSLIPVGSIVFSWVIFFPVILFGKKGCLAGLAAWTVFILPYLFLLSRLTRVKEVFSIGAAMAVVCMIFLWLAAAVFGRMGEKRRLEAFGVVSLLAVPFLFVINIVLSKMISEPIFDVWDGLTVFVLLAVAFAFFLCSYRKKKRG